MATPGVNMASKFSTTTSSHSSTDSNMFDKFAYLEKFRDDEPRQRWISIATFVMLITQILASTGGLILSGLVFGDRFNVVGQCASQSFVLFASILAIPYVTLHFRAAKTNFSIIRSQPFQHPLHSWTIIVARLAFLAWTVAVIAASVAVARASGDKIHLQLDIFFCVSAFLAMTFCLAVVEKAAEPFVLPWVSPSRSIVCRISDFGSFIDDSVSRRGSTGSAAKQQQMSEKPTTSERPVPAGPRPLDVSTSVASEPVRGGLHRSEDDDELLFPTSSSDAGDAYAQSEPALKLPEPTLPLLSDRYAPETPPQSADWKRDWSVFAGEAGLRASGGSTVADMSIFGESSSSASGLSQTAPYSVWTPTRPAQPAPAASRSHRPRTLTSSPSKPSLLATVHEVITPTVDIFEFMGGYSGPPADEKTGRSESSGTKTRRLVPKVTVEDVPDESFLVEQPGPPTPPKTPKMPGSFVDDYPTW